jgi:chromosome segregation ATPase
MQTKRQLRAQIEELLAVIDKIEQANKTLMARAQTSLANEKLAKYRLRHAHIVKTAPKHADNEKSKPMDLNQWAREMKAANPGNPFSWTD